uniref:Uncharacterized protein n=1 Tax=Trichogramma kaykai TaxID=54128 RepID=A0ABD2WR14_9HYME
MSVDRTLILDLSSMNAEVTNYENSIRESGSVIETVGYGFSPFRSESNSVSLARLDNYVYQVLMLNPEGQLQLHFFDFESLEVNRQSLLEKKGRLYFSTSVVARILILHEVQKSSSWQISSERLEQLADSCAQLFPGHSKAGFFKKSTATASASGTLHNTYDYIKGKASFTGLVLVVIDLNPKRKKPDENSYSETFEEICNHSSEIDEDFKAKWAETAIERRTFYKNNNLEIIFKKFLIFSNSSAYELIQEDFHKFFKINDSSHFQSAWPLLANKIIKYAQNQLIGKVQKKKNKDIDDILKDNSDCLAKQDKTSILAFKLLPYIFKKVVKSTVKSSSGKNWYPKKEEVEETFFILIKVGKWLQVTGYELRPNPDNDMKIEAYLNRSSEIIEISNAI